METQKRNAFIGDALRKLRIQGNFSQDFLAESLNISRNSYKDWENGKIDFTINKIERICQFYNIDFEKFITNSPPQKKYSL